MRVVIRGVSVLGPGMPDWESSRALLSGNAPYAPAPVALPAVEALPPAERRRTGPPVRLALTTGLRALSASGLDASQVCTVFTSSGGDGQVIHEICASLATEERDVSPTRFHNSVHNAPAGYWGIALRSHTASTSLCGFDWSFAAGLLEACAQAATGGMPVLLISYDLPYPEPLHQARPVVGTLGVGLVLVPDGDGVAKLDVDIDAERSTCTTLDHPELEALRQGNPTARALPLLHALATLDGAPEQDVRIEYLDTSLRLRVTRK
jgi:hypothetical protein